MLDRFDSLYFVLPVGAAPLVRRGLMPGVAVLGSTGSIGVSALNVLRRHPERFRVVALTGGTNADLLRHQAAEFVPRWWDWRTVKTPGSAAAPIAWCAAATHPDADIVLNAVVGFAGLDATLAALHAGKRVALANKESLVTAGELVMEAAREGAELVPVDSEHSAVLQCVGAAAGALADRASGADRQWRSVSGMAEARSAPRRWRRR